MFATSFLYLIAYLCGNPRYSVNSQEGEVIEKWHPLLPAEKKLIVYSLVAALILLLVLVWVSYTYFNVGK